MLGVSIFLVKAVKAKSINHIAGELGSLFPDAALVRSTF